MTPMNSRERVLASINHTEPDRIPVDLGATPSSSISAIAYDNLLPYLSVIDKRNWVYDVIQQVTQPSDEILDFFRIDAVDLGRVFNTKDSDWRDYKLLNGGTAQQPAWFHPRRQDDGSFLVYKGEEAIATMPATAISYDQVVYPFIDGYPVQYGSKLEDAMGRVHWGALVRSPWDHANEPSFWDDLRARALDLRATSDRVIVFPVGCNLFEWGSFLRRLDYLLMDLKRAPAEVERLLDALLERHLNHLEKICRAVGDVVDILCIGDDLGMSTGPMMGPETYRKFFKPRHTILCDYIKKHSSAHTFLHSCGSIYKLIPDLIEAGIEILNPVQTNTRDMEPKRLKKEFGADVTFWGGGADTRSVLNLGSPEQVKDNVRASIETLSPGGGFVFNTIHNILPDVPPQNIIAMFEAVDEYR